MEGLRNREGWEKQSSKQQASKTVILNAFRGRICIAFWETWRKEEPMQVLHWRAFRMTERGRNAQNNGGDYACDSKRSG
jgi:hypothetical protein